MRPHPPARGDVIVIDFEPRAGSEIGKRRPALVISPRTYNSIVGLVLVCPITTAVRDYPFEVAIRTDRTVGAVLADRLHSFDWRARRAALVERAPRAVLDEVQAKLLALIDPD